MKISIVKINRKIASLRAEAKINQDIRLLERFEKLRDYEVLNLYVRLKIYKEENTLLRLKSERLAVRLEKQGKYIKKLKESYGGK